MSPRPTRATAPGKMMLSGEYAVLDGSPAVVCAVQRRAVVEWFPEAGDRDVARGLDHDTPRFPEVAAVQRLGGLDGALTVDTSALRGPDVKLGLGSSAAAAAAAAALVHARTSETGELASADLFDLAFRGHAEVAPQGSGADVAASAHGGIVLYTATTRDVVPIEWPAGLEASVVFTGHAASTRELVGLVRELQASDPARYQRAMDDLAETAGLMADAFRTGDVARVITTASAYHQRMAALGEAAGAPIVEERLQTLSDLARAADGAAKPSGAGGGDVGIAFFAGPEAKARYERSCADAGFEVLAVELGGPGPLIDRG